MIICMDFDKSKIITRVDEWEKICPPAKAKEHWKDERIAKELAKDWIDNKGQDLERLIGTYSEFNEITFKRASTEHVSQFDEYEKGHQFN